ncbi:hypothetical protein BX600DRAFT_460962 [Xylariales sp. PMI_506]|nr:hypothetical protein BX600DRAFT_460962 [Xylariales sp. PMI_506]
MLLQFLHLGQAALAGYGANQSYEAIWRLQKYESTSEKLAQYSSEAARQLHKTRTTQTAGVLAMLASLVVSLFLAFQGSSYSLLVRYLASPAMVGAVSAARMYIQDYWVRGSDGQTVGVRVPLPKMGEFNEAQAHTEELLKVMSALVMSWLGTSLVTLVVGYN